MKGLSFNLKRFIKSFTQKIHYKILIPFLIIISLTTIPGIYFTLMAIDKFSENRVIHSIDEDLNILNKILQEINERTLFYSRVMADAERLSQILANSEKSRNILILLIQTLKEQGMLMDQIRSPDPNKADFSLIKKGFLGIRASSIVASGEGEKGTAYLEAVAPIEEKTGISSVISVKFPIDDNFLQFLRAMTQSNISIYLPNATFLSTIENPDCKDHIHQMAKNLLQSKQAKSISKRFRCGNFDTFFSDFKLNNQKFGVIALSISIADLISARKSFLLNTIPYIFLSTLILIAIYISLITNITDPIKKLSNVAQKLAKGDMSADLPAKSHDEIGELIRSFEYMIGEIKNYKKQMEQWTSLLEREIEERTKQLKETHLQLAMASRLAALGELSAGVAHELNNPIGGILGYAQFALERIRNRKNEEISSDEIERLKKYLSYIEKEAQRCRTIVHNLLKFSRGTHMFMELLDINQVINETITFTSHQLRINNIELIVDLKENLPKIKGSAHHLQQVFTNIIINAQQAMPNGGKLYIETRAVWKGKETARVEIEFRDTGHGIPEEIQDKIFEPFFTTRESGKGTGLGLSVSYGIIKEHGGEITVKSKPGEGASFIIRLPS